MRVVHSAGLALAVVLLGSGCATVCSSLSGEAKTLCEKFQTPEPATSDPAVPTDPTVPTEPTPTPTPEAGTDAIDPATVVWDEQAGNVGAWEQNVTMTDVTISGGKIAWKQTGATWPSVTKEGWTKAAVGNIWVIARVHGTWHAATWDWIGPGVRTKEIPDFSKANDIHGEVLEAWVPVQGEEVGVMLSTFARAYLDPSNQQRSGIVTVRWP